MKSLVETAEEIATKAHEGQIRKFGPDKGKPYIIHPKRVAEKFVNHISPNSPNNEELMAVALLHDVLEDTDITKEELKNLGIPENVIEQVDILTKREGEIYLDFILRIKESGDKCFNSYAMIVKKEDILDNMLSLPEGSLKDKYRLAYYILDH